MSDKAFFILPKSDGVRAWALIIGGGGAGVVSANEVLRLEAERDEARRHLRQLLHALDSMSGADLSWSVRQVMREARAYLQASPAGEDKADPSPGPSRCSHGATHFVCGMRWRGDGDGGNYDVSLCYDCGRFHVRGLSNGEPFDVSFNLHLQEQLDAVARGVAYYTEEEQPT